MPLCDADVSTVSEKQSHIFLEEKCYMYTTHNLILLYIHTLLYATFQTVRSRKRFKHGTFCSKVGEEKVVAVVVLQLVVRVKVTMGVVVVVELAAAGFPEEVDLEVDLLAESVALAVAMEVAVTD